MSPGDGEVHSPLERHHTEERVAGNPAAARMLVIDHMAGSRVEERSNSADIDCKDQT